MTVNRINKRAGVVVLLLSVGIVALSSCKPRTSSHLQSAEGAASPGRNAGAAGPNGMTFVAIPAGTFTMGSPAQEEKRRIYENQHQVTISKGFEIQTTEVTQDQWIDVMGSNPSYAQSMEQCPDDFVVKQFPTACPHFPVEDINWDDAQEFVKKINSKNDGYIYRLPTEAEWEFAARAGTTTPFAGTRDDLAWHVDNSGLTTHAVGKKQPNPWGLYDMHGNVWEWVSDMYGSYPAGSVTDPVGPASGEGHVARGGAFNTPWDDCRSAFRLRVNPQSGVKGFGLRLARTHR